MRNRKLGFIPSFVQPGLTGGKAGFTLSELLISAAILAFVFSSLIMLFINSSFLIEASRSKTIAVDHAQFALEEVKNTPFGGIAAATWNSAAISSKGLIPLQNESIGITVTGTEPKDVRVTVTWRDRRMSNKSLSLETLITEP
jgi:prepilin-type N-terminal cleavage/methylation domain-containing protein